MCDLQLKCGQIIRDHTIGENRPSLSWHLTIVNSPMGRGGKFYSTLIPMLEFGLAQVLYGPSQLL